MDVLYVTDYVSEAKQEGYESGKAEGRAEGRAEGLKEGEIRKSAEAIVGIMQKFGCPLEETLDVVRVSEEDRDEVLRLVKEIQEKS